MRREDQGARKTLPAHVDGDRQSTSYIYISDPIESQPHETS